MKFNLTPLSPFVEPPGEEYKAPPLDSTPHEKDTLDRILHYLENATIVHAWMGYSEDLIGGKFDTPGGHAVMSDGKYYWRYDAMDYLKHYPIRISETAISHFASNNWTPPKFELGTPEYSALEDALDEIYVPSNDNDIVILYPTNTPTDNVN